MSGSAHIIFSNIHHRTIPTVENIEKDFKFSPIKIDIINVLLNFNNK